MIDSNIIEFLENIFKENHLTFKNIFNKEEIIIDVNIEIYFTKSNQFEIVYDYLNIDIPLENSKNVKDCHKMTKTLIKFEKLLKKEVNNFLENNLLTK